MEVVYTLIPGMIFFGLVLVGILIWAVKRGHYEDLEGDAQRILMDEDEPLSTMTEKRQQDSSEQRNWPDADSE